MPSAGQQRLRKDRGNLTGSLVGRKSSRGATAATSPSPAAAEFCVFQGQWLNYHTLSWQRVRHLCSD